MKKVLLINILFILSLSMLNAQTSKGKLLVGASSSFSLTSTGSNLMFFGYSTSKYKSDARGFKESVPDKTIGFNLIPKIGYFVVDNLALGVDLSSAISNTEYNADHSESKVTLFSVGPFVRYYIPSGKILPFFELGGSFGSLKNKYSTEDINYNYNYDEKSSIIGLGAGLGIAAPLGNRATFDVMLGYNSLTVKNTKDNPDNERTVFGSIGLKLGFIVFLGAN